MLQTLLQVDDVHLQVDDVLFQIDEVFWHYPLPIFGLHNLVHNLVHDLAVLLTVSCNVFVLSALCHLQSMTATFFMLDLLAMQIGALPDQAVVFSVTSQVIGTSLEFIVHITGIGGRH